MRRRVDRQCKCGATIPWCYNVCRDCSLRRFLRSRYLSGATLAHGAVAQARRHGELADPRTMSCTDCEGTATEYDHRDYNEPLKVEPVCRGCNARRGKAIQKTWKPGEFDAYVARAAAINWPGQRFLVELYERFKHELSPQ